MKLSQLIDIIVLGPSLRMFGGLGVECVNLCQHNFLSVALGTEHNKLNLGLFKQHKFFKMDNCINTADFLWHIIRCALSEFLALKIGMDRSKMMLYNWLFLDNVVTRRTTR